MEIASFRRRCCALIVTGLLCAITGAAQETPTILQVEVENYVAYVGDVTDASRTARSPGPVAPSQGANFGTLVILADVTKVNGATAKGVMVIRSQTLRLSPTPVPGAAIADVTRAAHAELSWEFLNEDGSQIGTIYAMSLSGGAPSPGAPEDAQGGAAAIVGGTGAFVGARGTINPTEIVNSRTTSQAEDPSMRRVNGGGRARFVFQVYPMVQPEVVSAGGGFEVFHSDNSRVTVDKPARPGEALVLRAKGSKPAEVSVNDEPSKTIEVEGQGTTGFHRVKFSVPDEVQAGVMKVQISAAWMKGKAVEIPVARERGHSW
jgi:hypothetical protein